MKKFFVAIHLNDGKRIGNRLGSTHCFNYIVAKDDTEARAKAVAMFRKTSDAPIDFCEVKQQIDPHDTNPPDNYA